MASERTGVEPLRISKNSSSRIRASVVPRPLSEISPMGVRRNSPSFNQTATKRPSLTSATSSPFEASPVANSKLAFWRDRENVSPTRRDSENSVIQPISQSPKKRNSVENLKKVSRVTNSNMYALEQDSENDPDASSLLSNKPFSPFSGNTWGGAIDLRSNPSQRGHRRAEGNTKIPLLSPTKASSPSKLQASPPKSALSSVSRYSDEEINSPDEAFATDETVIISRSRGGTPRSLRQMKSVTFDEQPPQINEYEMITPDPSSVASGSREGSYESDQYDMDESFERSFGRDDSFDESLEDTDKTPVVLPEDWRFMSPKKANTGLAETFDDPFESQQSTRSPSQLYRGTPDRDVRVARSSSITSSGDPRPLPPLPGDQSQDRQLSTASLSALPKARPITSTPPRPASMSKADILGMRASPMPLEERLQLLSIQQQEAQKKAEEARKAEDAKKCISIDEPKTLDQETSHPADNDDYQPPPRISRESILRNMEADESDDEDYDGSSPFAPRSIDGDVIDYANLDPDVPIPSLETISAYDDHVDSTRIKREEDVENTIDMYAQSDNISGHRPISPYDDEMLRQSAVHPGMPEDGVSEVSTEGSHSEDYMEEPEDMMTPRVASPIQAPVETKESKSHETNRMSLPEFTSFFDKEDFGFGLESYLTPSPPQPEPTKAATSTEKKEVVEQISELTFDLRPSTPTEQLRPPPVLRGDSFEETFGTPDSVIHYPLPEDPSIVGAEDDAIESEPINVPDPVSTIKAPGSKLKTRVSMTPADIQQMAAARRHVSGELNASSIESVQETTVEQGSKIESSTPPVETSFTIEPVAPAAPFNRRRSVRKLDIPLEEASDDLGFGLNQEFDRLIEAKKKGYLMRQNTKVVVANSRQPSGESKASDVGDERPISSSSAEDRPGSARGTRSAGNSPRKSSAQTWTTEPWNGRIRRQSTRRTNIVPERGLSSQAAPPLPGQESNVLGAVAEDSLIEDIDESGERGRLFVKVIGVKDLDLPLPKNERCHFQMTLDNGLHCVTTSWAELGRTAPIGQEFELVVFDDLEFQLLLQTQIERPTSSASSVRSSNASLSPKKPSALSRMFTSPKKRRELEKKQQEEEARLIAQRQAELDAERAAKQPTAWDLQNELVGPDGSFARAYISLSNHENQCFGRPLTVEIPAWNEWAVESNGGASTRSKMGGVQRKPPYRIGNMELQIMYIPRPKEVTDDEMPRSMSAAIRQLKESEATVTRSHEGHLSQQGGDCPYWRRRFFKLNGSKLTAYHDMTRQPRATISLTKATKLIDDKSSLTKTDQASPVKGKGRRKSAFAEDEEGYMFVEEGFRIRFQNGEVIDFYADTREHKEEWMKVLSEAVGRESPSEKKTWMSVVLAKERAATAAANIAAGKGTTKLHQVKEGRIPVRETSKIAASAPTSPQKQDVFSRLSATSGGLKENKPLPIEKDSHLQSSTKNSTTSPVKGQTGLRSPIKADSTSSSSPSKRNSGPTGSMSSASSPKKQEKAVAGKRQGVRSMIF